MENSSNDWRPKSGWDIELNDVDLMKVGLIVQLEAQAKTTIVQCLSPVLRQSGGQLADWADKPLKRITSKLAEAAALIDNEFSKRLAAFEECRERTHDARHQMAHASWGRNEKLGHPQAIDLKRGSVVEPGDIEGAMAGMAELSILARQCFERIAELVDDKTLPCRDPLTPGVSFFWRDRWIAV